MTALHHVVAGSGPPLLLIHGTGGDADVFAAALPLLAEQCRVIAYDRRGHGRSPGPPLAGAHAHATHAEDALALLDRVAPGEPAWVLGWSAGGIVALHLALAHPTRVAGLVLVEPSLWARRASDLRMTFGIASFFWHTARRRPREAAAAFYRTVTRYRDGGANGFDALPPERQQAILANDEAIAAEVRAGTGEGLTPARLATLRCPTTLVLGERSAPLFARLGEALGAALPGLTTVTVPDVGHLMMLESASVFSHTVLAVVKDLRGR
jgi:pimeloyl-ACP methyl ester carboxylesterase